MFRSVFRREVICVVNYLLTCDLGFEGASPTLDPSPTRTRSPHHVNFTPPRIPCTLPERERERPGVTVSDTSFPQLNLLEIPSESETFVRQREGFEPDKG